MFRPQTVIIRAIKNILFKVQKGSSDWDPISFTVGYKIIYKNSYLQSKQLKLSIKQIRLSSSKCCVVCGPQFAFPKQ